MAVCWNCTIDNPGASVTHSVWGRTWKVSWLQARKTSCASRWKESCTAQTPELHHALHVTEWEGDSDPEDTYTASRFLSSTSTMTLALWIRFYFNLVASTTCKRLPRHNRIALATKDSQNILITVQETVKDLWGCSGPFLAVFLVLLLFLYKAAIVMWTCLSKVISNVFLILILKIWR